nr:MAG TPA: hypothetical protein [Ackermannviridae sp.]
MIRVKNATYKHLQECLNAVYIEKGEYVEIDEGCLLDNYTIDKVAINFDVKNEFINFIRKYKNRFNTIKFKEIYLNSWSSGYEVYLI